MRPAWLLAGLRLLPPVTLMAACAVLAPMPQLVRDGAGLFSARARAEAEARLSALSAEHGVLLFVVTDTRPDPPRMLERPMADARERGLPAMAVLYGPTAAAGVGGSDEAVAGFSPPAGVDGLLADGRADRALEILVDHIAAWVADPGPVNGPPRREGPSPAG